MIPSRAAAVPASPLWLLLVLCGVLVVLINADPIADYDFWEHLIAGKHIWTSHQVPQTNLWTWPDHGSEDVDPSWGFQVLLYPFYARGGVLGLYLLRWGTALAALALALAAARSLGAGWRISALAGLLATLIERSRMLPRPETLAMVLLGVFVWILERKRRTLEDATAWLPAVSMLWVNVHLSALLGPLVVAVHAMAEALRRGDQARSRRLKPWIVLAGCVASLFVNPFGWRAVEQPLRFALEGRGQVMYRTVAELQAPDFGSFWRTGLPVALVLWPAMWVSRAARGRRDWVELSLLLLFTLLACNSRRFVGFYAVALAPYLARDLTETIGPRLAPRSWTSGARTTAAAGIAVLMVVPNFADGARRPSLGIVRWAQFPGVCDFIIHRDVRGRMFNHFHMGGYLLWRLWPERLPFRTGRLEIAQKASIVDMNLYTTATVVERDWNRLLERFQFDHVVLDRLGAKDSIAGFLERDPQWALVFADDEAALFARRGARFDRLIAEDAYHVLPVGPTTVERMGVRASTDTSFRRELRGELERAAATSRDNASALSQLANLDMLDARWTDARAHLEQARRVDPELRRYFERLGLLSLVQGRAPEALVWFERQRRATPRDEDVEARLGQAYLALGDTARARAQFERELARHPGNRIARALLGPLQAP